MTEYEGDDSPSTREQWLECGGGPAALVESLEAWATEHHGGEPWALGDTVGDLLDELAARGFRVTAIDPGPPLESLLPVEGEVGR